MTRKQFIYSILSSLLLLVFPWKRWRNPDETTGDYVYLPGRSWKPTLVNRDLVINHDFGQTMWIRAEYGKGPVKTYVRKDFDEEWVEVKGRLLWKL